jgi:hypothetical protein
LQAGGLLDKVESFPYFKKKVLELYEQFVERRAQYSQERSMDEFYCTRLIYWEITKYERATCSPPPHHNLTTTPLTCDCPS